MAERAQACQARDGRPSAEAVTAVTTDLEAAISALAKRLGAIETRVGKLERGR
jgi:hypothetical protein